MKADNKTLTAEEFLNIQSQEIGYIDYYNLLTELDPTRIKHLTKKWFNQYVNTKVLLVLEEEVPKAYYNGNKDKNTWYTDRGEEYFEKYIKSNYE